MARLRKNEISHSTGLDKTDVAFSSKVRVTEVASPVRGNSHVSTFGFVGRRDPKVDFHPQFVARFEHRNQLLVRAVGVNGNVDRDRVAGRAVKFAQPRLQPQQVHWYAVDAQTAILGQDHGQIRLGVGRLGPPGIPLCLNRLRVRFPKGENLP